MHEPHKPAAAAELRGLLDRAEFEAVVRFARAELHGPHESLPRGVLLHALGVGLAAPPEAPEHDLAEAIQALEEALLRNDAAGLTLGDVLGPVARHLATCYRRWRAGDRATRGPAPVRRGQLFARLVSEGRPSMRARRFEDVEALLSRALEVALWLEPGEDRPYRMAVATDGTPAAVWDRREEDPQHHATDTVLRVLREYVAEEGGARKDTSERVRQYAGRKHGMEGDDQERLRQDLLDRARFSYDPAGRDAYVGVIAHFGIAAAQSDRAELARRILERAIDLQRWAAEEDGGPDAYAAYAAAATTLGRIAAAAGAYAQAYLLSEHVRRLCDAGRCATGWRRHAVAGVGIAMVGLGRGAEGQRLLHGALAGTATTDGSPWRLDAMRWLYEARLDAHDAAGAVECHLALVAAGSSQGTSREEVEARAAERPDPERAIRLYRQLIEDVTTPRPGQGAWSSTIWRVTLRLGRLLLDRGAVGEAYHLVDHFYGPLKQVGGHDHPAMSELDELVAEIELGVGRPQIAFTCLGRATARDSRAAARQLAVGSSAQRGVLLAGMRRRVEAAVSVAVEHFREHSPAVGAAHALVNRRKGLNASVDWQLARELAERAATDADAREVQRQLADVRGRITRAVLAQMRGGHRDAGLLERLLAEREALEWEASFQVGGVAVGSHVEEPNPASIAACIPEDSAFVDYVRYRPMRKPGDGAGDPEPPTRYCAFVIRARYHLWQVVDLGEAEAVDRLVARFRRGVTGAPDASRDLIVRRRGRAASSDADAMAAGRRLRQLIFDPLLPAVEARTRLVVSPDAALFSVPLECLPTDDGGHLIERYCISYAPSTRSVMYMQSDVVHDRSAESAARCSAPLVVGAPDYDHAPDDGGGTPPPNGTPSFAFRPLPGTREEAVTVARLLGVRPTLGPSAVKSRLAAVRSPLVLHLATHGFILDRPGSGDTLAHVPLLRAGLAFAGANTPGVEDAGAGILTADEVLSLDLRGTALAVLSACETGLGETEHGEGLASLGRSFEAAGAACVVVGLWKVPDDRTRDLMQEFYRHLVDDTGSADSIRRAKLELRRRHPDVYSWGAFVCLGRWGTIATDSWAP